MGIFSDVEAVIDNGKLSFCCYLIFFIDFATLPNCILALIFGHCCICYLKQKFDYPINYAGPTTF